MAQEDPHPSNADEAPRAGPKAAHGAGGVLGAVAGAAAGAALGALAGPVGLVAGAVAGGMLGAAAGGNTVERLDRNAARYVAGSGHHRSESQPQGKPTAAQERDRPR